ncbi:MAG: hypothetical protein JNJ42_19125 [Burkholderiaceae bacterium]|nr:hypothetical protein [Burkholderiaceae bacterium]
MTTRRIATAADVLDAINHLERHYPVQQWHAGDVDLWPAYRVRLFMNATLALLAQAPVPHPARRLAALAGRGLRALLQVPLAALRDRRMNDRPQPGHAAVFLSDGLSFTRQQGRWVDRVIDPLVLALQQRGQACLKLTPLAAVHVPRLLPSMLVQPAIDRLKLLARWRPLHDTDLPGFDALQIEAQLRLGEPNVPSRDWLLLQARRMHALAAWFAALLRTSGATWAFVNNYYSIEGMAFVVAARRGGLRSADLQHGLQGEHHGAYGRWAAVPAVGYTTLPDEFWVWSRDEADAIDRWRGECACHVPRISGNPWRERWLDDRDPQVAEQIENARAMRAPSPAVQVLVSLAWGLADEETDKILRAAELAGRGVGWWWRLHPVEAHRAAEFAARLRRHGLPAEHVQAVTDAPLFALIRAADVVVAHSSTVIQEATLFGVPAVVTSDYGAEIYAALVDAGRAVRATDDAAIAAAVAALPARPPLPRAPAIADMDGLARLLDSLRLPPAAALRSATR